MTVLARRGVAGYRQYRIPALATAGATVLCAYDGRPDLDDLPAPIDLLLRRSEDGGRTWSAQQVVRAGEGFEGFGDPSLLVDPVTGKVLLFHAAGRHAGFFESGDGERDDDPDLQHCDLSVSADAGRSWQHRRLTSQLRRSGNASARPDRIAGIFAASGAGCALTAGPHSGRLIQPYVVRIGGRIDVACALSDDHGATWRLSAPIGADAGVELNESSVCMLPDGTVLLHSRGIGHRWAARSSDGGETFDQPVPLPELLDPSVNGSVIAVGGATGGASVGGDILLASHCADPQLRRHAVISRSDDGGASWRSWRTVEPGSAGYTQLAELPDGRIGIAYEANGYQEIRFEAFDQPEPTSQIAASTHDAPVGQGASAEAGSAAETPGAPVSRGASAEAGNARETLKAPPAWDASAEAVGTGTAETVGGVTRGAASSSAGARHETAAPGWVRAVRSAVVLDVVLRSVVPARPDVWVEAGPTHEIDLDEFEGVDPAVFKEIGQDRDSGAMQVLRTRESLTANLGPVHPGIHAGDRLEIQARLRNDGASAVAAEWEGQERRLGAGELWLRRDLAHLVTTADTERGHAEVSCAVVVDGRPLRALLVVPADGTIA